MPARLCQQGGIQGRGRGAPPPPPHPIFRPNWDLGPRGRKIFLDTAPPPLSQGLDDWGFPLSQDLDDWGFPLSQGPDDRAPSYFRLNDRPPPLSQVEWPGPPLIWRSGFTTGQGPLLSCSSFAKGMKKSMNLRSFYKTKPLSASFPLKNFILTLSTNFTFFINSFVYLFGRLRRRELTHEHRNSQRVHLLQLITFSFFRVRRAKRETRKWPQAWLTARDARGTKTERLSFFFSGCRRRFARVVASPLPRACTALTKSEEKERLLAVYHS